MKGGITDLASHDKLCAFSLFPIKRVSEVAKLLLCIVQSAHLLVDDLQLFHTRAYILPRCDVSRCGVDGVSPLRAFSIFSRAAIFACRSLVFVSLVATVRFSSEALLPILWISRFMRSGDCTIRERVREMLSVTVSISLVTFSCMPQTLGFEIVLVESGRC